MATIASIKFGTIQASDVISISIREQSESSSVNRYVSGVYPGPIEFTAKADGTNLTYVLSITTKDCGVQSGTFTLIEPCEGLPSTIVETDCATTISGLVTINLKATLAKYPTVRVKILSGSSFENQLVNREIPSNQFTNVLVPTGTLRIIAEHPEFPNCRNQIDYTVTCSCSFSFTVGDITETPSEEVVAPIEQYVTESVYRSGNYNVWDRFGYFRNTYESAGAVIDAIGGNINNAYTYENANQKISNLGIKYVPIYYKNGTNLSEFLTREPIAADRYWYGHQSVFERTNPSMPEFFKDLHPYFVGKPFTLDSGEVFNPNEDAGSIDYYRTGNIVFAWYNRSTQQPAGSTFGLARYNNEGHQSYDGSFYRYLRYIGNGGMYRPARIGGNNTNKITGESKKPSEPDYAAMSDAQWLEHFQKSAVSYIQWVYSAEPPSTKAMGYDLDSRAGDITMMKSPGSSWENIRGYRKRPMWHFIKSYANGKTLKETQFASNNGWLDLMFKASPIQICETTVVGNGNNTLRQADLGLAENTVPSNTITEGAPEFYRFKVNRQSSACSNNSQFEIRFEDKEGNLRRTDRVLIVETAVDDYSNAPKSTRTTIPIGTTTISVCHHLRVAERWNNTLDDFIDEALVRNWEYMQYNYIADGGKPFNYQIYPHILADRFPLIANETTNAGQLPLNLVRGLRYLAYTYNAIQVFYTALSNVNGLRTLDNLYGVEKEIHEHMDHFVDGQVLQVPVEVSLDNGVTWTSSTIASYRTDIVQDYEKEGFLVNNPNALNSDWVNNRRSNKNGSPLILATYNETNQSYVIFTKALFTDLIVCSYRFKNGDTYQTFTNQIIDREGDLKRVNI